MDIDKRSRADLKSYFVKNSIPIERNFADLIEGMLNQKDDGMVKLPGEPLSIQATGDQMSLKKVINFYDDFVSTKPTWTLSLHGRTDPGKPETNTPGWNLSDGDGRSRLFIDRNTGYVGVGTVKPQNQLHVGSGSTSITTDRANVVVASESIDAGIAVAQKDGVNVLLQAAGAGGYIGTTSKHKLTLRTNNDDRIVIDADGKVGIGATPSYDLHLAAGKTLRIDGGTGGSFSFGGIGPFGVDALNVPNGRFVVLDSGAVGIGTPSPLAKLSINGGLHVGGESDPGDNNLLVDGKVGIGGTPVYDLHLADGKTLRIDAITSGGFSLGPNATFGLDVPNTFNGRFVVLGHGAVASGAVGIGTPSPLAKLSINGGLHVGGDSDPGDNNLLVDGKVGIGATPGYDLHLAEGKTLRIEGGASGGFSLGPNATFGLDVPNVLNGRFVVLGTGQVGIGTPSPLAKLSINGGLHVGGDSDPGDKNLLVDGTSTVTGVNPIRFTSKWSSFPDDKDKKNRAEISNDTGDYKTLMIVGNRSADLKTAAGDECRRVGIWDRLDVHGELFQMLPVIACKGNDKWGTDTNHPLRQYFRNKLTGQPNGTVLQAMADLPAWGGLIWFGWKGSDGKLRLSHTAYSDPKEI